MLTKSAVCYGCGMMATIQRGARAIPIPNGWFKIKAIIWNGLRSEVWFCSHECVFKARARGNTYPEPVIVRDIYMLDTPESSVVSMRRPCLP